MIVVFGATGNIGTYVIRGLAKKGVAVRAVTRNISRALWMRELGVEVVSGDLTDKDSIKAALDNCEGVFLVMSQHPQQDELEGNVIEAAGDRYLVKISSLAASRAGTGSIILDAHRSLEEKLHTLNRRFTLLQPTQFYQTLLASAPMIVNRALLASPAGSETRIAMVDVRDVADVAVTCLTEPGHEGVSYEITGPIALSYPEIATLLTQVVGREIRYVQISGQQRREALLSAGRPEWFAAHLEANERLYADGLANRVTDAVKRVTGHPARQLYAFLKEYASAFGSGG